MYIQFTSCVHGLSTILESSSKSVWSIIFCSVKVYILWKFIHYRIHWDKTQMLKKFSSGKISVSKSPLFFFSRAPPTHHRFAFNPRFLCELNRKVRVSKTMFGIFDSVLFLLKFIFLFYRKHVLFQFKTS